MPPSEDETLLVPTPPRRDLYDLTRRLRTRSSAPIPHTLGTAPPQYDPGHRETFWITNLETYTHFTATAILRQVTPHAYWYVQEGVEIPADDIKSSAAEFENHIYPTVRQYFGTEWSPGVDNDPHLNILNARIPGVGGYFSSADEYPTVVNPYSNQREIIYVNISAARPGSPLYNAILAHEFQHAVHWNMDQGEEAWINEGMAELSSFLAGYKPSLDRSFLASPDIQLDTWPDDPAKSAPHYGASYLFLKYLSQHYGGYEGLKDLTAEREEGIAGINAYLARRGYKKSFIDVFKDWVIANYLDKQDNSPYSYPDEEIRVRVDQTITSPGQLNGTVHQFAADYIDLKPGPGDFLLEFQGEPRVKLIPNDAHSGRKQWWANRGDAINTTLTREIDLTGVPRATLTFWAWYDIENNWDHAYVEVSTDGGKTWIILPGSHTTTENPLGNSFGPAYTGISGGGKDPAWTEENIDLSPYVGKKILLRFEYLTDEAVNKNGFSIDDIAIPEIGFADDGEDDRGWKADGFFRTGNTLAERFLVQLIKLNGQPVVEAMPLDTQQRGQITIRGLGREIRSAVLVVAAITPVTTETAPYKVSIKPLRP
ncbi:MAG: immune inhibitor A [Chloroflexi bacterium]|nr:immune inhibitor A [Chloroflexota bacterium]